MNPVELLQNLIRFETINPPGNEAACIAYLDSVLREAGLETQILEKFPGRPNLLARLKGTGNAPPLLFYGHVDVVPVTDQRWTHPPFSGDIIDGYVWGRGALDMKGGIAMLVTAFLRAHAEGFPLSGDLILCIVSDEERGGDAGARFLVEEHADLFSGVRHAIGEFGGFTLYLGGKKFYTIQVAEKQALWLRATTRGPAGHASAPVRGGAMAKMGALLTALDDYRPPAQITPPAEAMFSTIADGLDAPLDGLIRGLLDPAQSDSLIDMLGDMARSIYPLLHNTVSPTVLRAGEATNVIPAAVMLDLDVRLLPGVKVEDFLADFRAVIGEHVELENLIFDPGPGAPDMSLFNRLAGVLREVDPDGIPVPYLLGGVTDARFFTKLGIQTYGFLPMQLPDSLDFASFIHAADERIPVEAVGFGVDVIERFLRAGW